MRSKKTDPFALVRSPLSQRIWIALEAKGLAYQYVETDPFRRPAAPPSTRQQQQKVLEANSQGRIPAIQMDTWVCADSGVILEYVSCFRRVCFLFSGGVD